MPKAKFKASKRSRGPVLVPMISPPARRQLARNLTTSMFPPPSVPRDVPPVPVPAGPSSAIYPSNPTLPTRNMDEAIEISSDEEDMETSCGPSPSRTIRRTLDMHFIRNSGALESENRVLKAENASLVPNHAELMEAYSKAKVDLEERLNAPVGVIAFHLAQDTSANARDEAPYTIVIPPCLRCLYGEALETTHSQADPYFIPSLSPYRCPVCRARIVKRPVFNFTLNDIIEEFQQSLGEDSAVSLRLGQDPESAEDNGGLELAEVDEEGKKGDKWQPDWSKYFGENH
ncbi:hypothetical protein PQX77_001412 [Marasmius sp. AFHP31]|nr:hypothetical protein PQX77_001412 [Marasmius sp. AFHP31]